jgi:hypothetical protein
VHRNAPVPPGVSATRVITFVQGGLGALSGLLLVFGGGAISSSYGATGTLAGVAVVVIGLVFLAVSAVLIWAGLLLGQLSQGARLVVLIVEWLIVALGLIGLTHPGLGIVGLVLAGVAVYYLQFDAQTRAAFAAAPGGYGAGRPPGRPPPYIGPPPTGRGVQPPPAGSSAPPGPPSGGQP